MNSVTVPVRLYGELSCYGDPNDQNLISRYVLQDCDRILFFPLKMLPTQLDFDMRMTDKITRTVQVDEDLNLYYLYE